MSAQVWLVFVAACVTLFSLPSPVAFRVSSYVALRGRRTMIAAVSGAALGLATALTGAILVLVAADRLPAAMLDIVQWAAIGWLMLFALWSVATPAAREALADNDNLRGKTFGSIFADCFALSALRLRYFGFFVAFLLQFLNGSRNIVEMLAQMQAVALVCAFVCLTLQACFAGTTIELVRRASLTKKIKNPRRNHFIAGRAVTAGYRRIAA